MSKELYYTANEYPHYDIGKEIIMNHSEAVKKYHAKLDEFKIRPYKDEGQIIRKYAADHNMSVQNLFFAAVREYMQNHPEEPERRFAYGMRLRGYSPGAQPKGVVERMDDEEGRYYDIIIYDRQLTKKEIKEYSLDELKGENK